MDDQADVSTSVSCLVFFLRYCERRVQLEKRINNHLWLRFQRAFLIHFHKCLDDFVLVFCHAVEKLLAKSVGHQNVLEPVRATVNRVAHERQRWGFRIPETGAKEGSAGFDLEVVACVRTFTTRARPGPEEAG